MQEWLCRERGMLFLEEGIKNPCIILFVITNPEQQMVWEKGNVIFE